MYNIISPTNRDNLTSPICIPLISFSAPYRKGAGTHGQPCLVSDFNGIGSSFSSFFPPAGSRYVA